MDYTTDNSGGVFVTIITFLFGTGLNVANVYEILQACSFSVTILVGLSVLYSKFKSKSKRKS